MNKQVICIVGPIASGKGTVIKFLEENGYYSSSTSDRIREEIKSRGLALTRTTLTDTANELREKYGSDILAKRTADILELQNIEKAVIDSIRNPEEINYFRRHYQAKVLAIVAKQERRYDWFIARQENSEPMTIEEFKELDNKEFNGHAGSHGQNVAECINMADKVIDNNGTVEELEEKIAKSLQLT